VHGLAGTQLPSSTIGQSAFGRHTSSPQAGDVSFFGTPPTHQGVHLDSGHILHSTDGGAVLRVSQLAHPAYLPGLTATRTY
jgi:cell wall-associated NlpC family hydrolase